MQEPIQEPMPVTTDPLLYRSNYFDAKELFALRELYGYGIISRDNMFRHLRILSEYPFLIDGMLISCNGGARATNIHSDAWLNFLSKITYGSPEELALLCFEMCSQGEGRVHYSDVMRVAKAANNIIQSHPLTALADARAGQQENAQTFLQNVGTNDPCLATSSLGLPQKPQNMSVYEVNHQGINKYANGMVSDNVPSEHGDEWSPGGNGFGVSGIGTRNGGYESLSLPEDVVDYLFSAKKRSTESKITGKSYVSYKEFLYKAKFIPEVSRCFGFFDFLYFLLIAPVITKLRDIPTLENFVKVSKKTAGINIKRRYHYCTVQLRDRFLIVTRKGRMHPWISLPLWHTFTQVKGRKMHTISIMSSDLEIKIRAPNLQDAALWVHCIRGNSRGNNLYDSFAPPRPNNICKWFINGKSYFDSLISIIPKAEKQILIIGWAFSPRMFLNRPDDPREQAVLQNDPAYRRSYHAHMQQHKHLVELIDLLVDRARAGVKVRVLVWNETNWGYMLNSHINKDMLEDIHENLEVVRHPPVVPLRWSHHQKMVVIDQRIAFIGGIDLVVGRYDDKYNRVCDPEGAIFPGNDYNNLVIGGVEAGDPKITQLDRRIQPRLPWHDTAVCVVGPAAYDAATSIIQIWNHAIGHVAKGKKYTRLVPFPYLHEELFARGNVENAIFHVGNKPPARPGRVSSGMTCQIVRSISPWASGQNVESSYYRAMLDSIRQAHHFVYIQNQYFISSIMHDIPGNKVALAIVERISLAIQTGKRFRVYIVLPVHSAGPVTSFATRAIIKWTRHTIFQGKESIYGKLRQRFSTVNPRDYISVCALRNWQIANDIVFTEQVYVHSKLLIVDDRIVVIGSGNINDRSMRGARDSETGVVISGGERTVTLMDGQPTEVSRFIQSMRIKLWNVHLGLYQSEHGYALAETRPIANINPAEMHAAEMQVSDAVADGTFFGVWNRTASHNTAIFAEVFGNGIVEHWPSSKHGKRDFYNNVTPLVVQKLSSVRGHLIEFPEDMFARDRGFMMWLLTKRFKVNLVV